jgi:hypothetical protein
MSGPKSSSRQPSRLSRLMAGEPFLFCLLIAIEAVVFAILIVQNRIPAGWDGFQYFHLHYYFLNNIVTAGEIPLWMPHLTHGTVSVWWYAIQAGIAQNILILLGLAAGPLVKHCSFIALFNLEFFFDELILLTGVWLLGKRYFQKTFTVFFVSLTVIGTCIWPLQPWHNFHQYFAIPLVLYFVHAFFETGRWRYAFLAGNLTAVQALGNLWYMIPVTTLTITLYILFFAIIARPFENIRVDRRALFTFLGIGISLALVYLISTVNANGIQLYSYGRDESGKTTLNTFLNYGGSLDLRKWVEVLFGVSPFIDMTLFMGVLSVPLMLLSFFKIERKNAHLFLLVIVLLLFSTGGPVAVFFYYVWPAMKFFRHLALVSPLIKLFLCFLVGIGWEVLFNIEHNRIKNFVAMGSLVLAGVGLFVLNMNRSAEFGIGLINWILHKKEAVEAAVLPYFADQTDLDRLTVSASFMVMVAILLFLLCRWPRRSSVYFFMGLLVTVHAADIYTYKLVQFKKKTVALSPEGQVLTRFQAMPYQRARLPAFTPVAREKILDELRFDWLYASTCCFLFKDTIDSRFSTDYWLKPFDQFLRAYGGVSLEDRAQHPKGYKPYGFLLFPPYISAEKLGGLRAEKLALFSSAHSVLDREQLAGLLRDQRFAGDLLFVEDPVNGTEPWTPGRSLSLDERIAFHYHVVRYDANHLEISMNNPTGRNAWLLYSDVWDPSWQAAVNGRAVPVLKAALAYKAVMVGPGQQTVRFGFSSPKQTTLSLICAVMALCWFFGTIFLIMKIVIRRD